MTYHRPTYMGSDDSARGHTDYYPWWLDNLADESPVRERSCRGRRGALRRFGPS